jgi:hypothetical protein
MIAAACLWLALAIEQPDEAARITDVDQGLPARVEAALERSPELLKMHRGYLDYLKAHPDVAAAEKNWNDQIRFSEFGALTRSFDEALNSDPEAEALYNRHFDHLREDASLRDAIEKLNRNELAALKHKTPPRSEKPGAARAEPPSMADALDFLNAHPDVALPFLQNPGAAMTPTPEALNPYLNSFAAHPEWLKGMRDAFKSLNEQPEAQARVLPWYGALNQSHPAVRAAYTALRQQFARQPSQFQAWSQRELALASDAQARNWIRYWHRKVRRIPDLAGGYERYLHTILEKLPQQEATEARLRKPPDATPEWPPKEAPPRLPDYHPPTKTASPKNHAPGEIAIPEIHHPVHPTVPHPQRPTPPTPPTPRERP